MMVAIPELDGGYLADDLRRPLGRPRTPGAAGVATWRSSPSGPRCWPPGRQAGGAAPDRARDAQTRGRAVQLPAQRGRGRHRGLSRRVRLAAAHAVAAMRTMLATPVDVPDDARCAARAAARGQCRAFRGMHANVAVRIPAGRPCPARSAGSPRSSASGVRRRAASRATAAARCSCSASISAMSSSACSPPSATRAIRCGCCSSAASPRPMPSRPSIATCARISRPCGAAFRHPWRARIHARQAGRPVGRMLAGPADRRPPERLSLRPTTRPRA